MDTLTDDVHTLDDEDHADAVECLSNFFAEKDEVLGIIVNICATVDNDNIRISEFEIFYATLEKILIKYQEQPTVLNPHLSDLLTPIISRLEVRLMNEDEMVCF